MTDRHTQRADRRRAEACVKACEGISTEALEAAHGAILGRLRGTLFNLMQRLDHHFGEDWSHSITTPRERDWAEQEKARAVLKELDQ